MSDKRVNNIFDDFLDFFGILFHIFYYYSVDGLDVICLFMNQGTNCHKASNNAIKDYCACVYFSRLRLRVYSFSLCMFVFVCVYMLLACINIFFVNSSTRSHGEKEMYTYKHTPYSMLRPVCS